ESHTTGYHGNEIVVLEATAVKSCEKIEELLKRDGILEEVLKNPEMYIEGGVIHLKVDKQSLYGERRLVLGGSDVVSVHLGIGSRTEPREKTAERIRQFLRGEEE
ncbi:MAG: RNA-binding domain-containing protein, partial [Thermoplasmata archaeon]